MAQVEHYGDLDGRSVEAVTLESGQLCARVVSYGARLTELWVPDRRGDLADIVLGHDSLAGYRATTTYFGATAGRYANRIRSGRFRLEGREHQLDLNEGGNHLHGGREGFDRKLWTLAEAGAGSATFVAVSEDGEMGYPGRCELSVRYRLEGARLHVTMRAAADAPTIANIVHHSYFNLAGHASGDVLGQVLRLDSRFYTPVDDQLIATGEIRSVSGTPFDFTTPKRIGQDIGALGEGGYDHNWCLDGAGEEMRLCAEALDPGSGRRLTLRTTEPGVQLYTGGYLDGSEAGKGGVRYPRYAGFTLETQKFPGSPNNAHFPSCVLRPGEPYEHRMVFAFGTD